MGLELSEAVNKEKKKKARETRGKRLRPDSPLQIVGEKGCLGIFLCFASSVRVGSGIGLGVVLGLKAVCVGSVLFVLLEEKA